MNKNQSNQIQLSTLENKNLVQLQMLSENIRCSDDIQHSQTSIQHVKDTNLTAQKSLKPIQSVASIKNNKSENTKDASIPKSLKTDKEKQHNQAKKAKQQNEEKNDLNSEAASSRKQLFYCGCQQNKKNYSSLASLKTHFYQSHNGVAPKGSSHDIGGFSTPQREDQSQLSSKMISQYEIEVKEEKLGLAAIKARNQENVQKKKRMSSISKSRSNAMEKNFKNQQNLPCNENALESRDNHFRKYSDSQQFSISNCYEDPKSSYQVEKSCVTVYGADSINGGGIWYSKSQENLDLPVNNEEDQDEQLFLNGQK